MKTCTRRRKTCIRLRKDGKTAFTDRVRFLRTLETYEEDCNNIREVRMLAKGADEISWGENEQEKGVLSFLYEENCDFKEEHAKCEADSDTMRVLQIFWEEACKK